MIRKIPIIFNLAEPIQGNTINLIQQVASETGVVIIASVFEKRVTGLYHNTAVVINDEGLVLGILQEEPHP